MNEREKRRKILRDKAEESSIRTDKLLENELESLRKATRSDLERLRPRIADEATYNRLIAIVEESTRLQENLAELKGRIESLGSKAIRSARDILKLLMKP
ncbi:unnamed protein product [marine sediment metagenome]|uniref:Uncharacterized protein n=1 Tax=marine sediment metagenome TaxID=412755 RepID=X1GNG2_9ZZZZ